MMKKYCIFFFASLVVKADFAQGYQVTLKSTAVKSGIAYLTYYMGSNLNVADSAAINNSGIAVFKGPAKLAPGIYVMVLPGKRLRVEFLIDKEQTISITVADTANLLNKTVITGSKENIPYMDYQKFVAVKGKLLQDERVAYAYSVTKADSLLHEKNYNTYNAQLNIYRENIIKTRPTSMLAVLLNAMKDPVLPSGTKSITHQDSVNNYYYYKSHYWDGINFMDARVIRTPFFLKKLERYYRETLPQLADTIIKDADYKLKNFS